MNQKWGLVISFCLLIAVCSATTIVLPTRNVVQGDVEYTIKTLDVPSFLPGFHNDFFNEVSLIPCAGGASVEYVHESSNVDISSQKSGLYLSGLFNRKTSSCCSSCG